MGTIRRGTIAALATLFTLLVSQAALAQTRYVRPDGNDINDGEGMGTDHAWQTLAHAMTIFNDPFELSFTEIHVAKGTGGHTYKPGDEPAHTF